MHHLLFKCLVAFWADMRFLFTSVGPFMAPTAHFECLVKLGAYMQLLLVFSSFFKLSLGLNACMSKTMVQITWYLVGVCWRIVLKLLFNKMQKSWVFINFYHDWVKTKSLHGCHWRSVLYDSKTSSILLVNTSFRDFNARLCCTPLHSSL